MNYNEALEDVNKFYELGYKKLIQRNIYTLRPPYYTISDYKIDLFLSYVKHYQHKYSKSKMNKTGYFIKYVIPRTNQVLLSHCGLSINKCFWKPVKLVNTVSESDLNTIELQKLEQKTQVHSKELTNYKGYINKLIDYALRKTRGPKAIETLYKAKEIAEGKDIKLNKSQRTHMIQTLRTYTKLLGVNKLDEVPYLV